MSSPPPGSAAYVPYLAYKSKRHSRNLSNPNPRLVPSQSPSPTSKHISDNGSQISHQPPKLYLDGENETSHEPHTHKDHLNTGHDSAGTSTLQAITPAVAPAIVFPLPPQRVSPTFVNAVDSGGILGSVNDTIQINSASDRRPESALSLDSSNSQSTSKKASTFRRVPRSNRNANVSSFGNQPTAHSQSISPHSVQPQLPNKEPSELSSVSVFPIASPVVSPGPAQPTPLPATSLASRNDLSQQLFPDMPLALPLKSDILLRSTSAPYRPGFQPKGVYRPLTDNFLAIRRMKRDSEGEGGITRVERTKLERRLEKLIALHFPRHLLSDAEEKLRPAIRHDNRRASSLFDFQNFRNVSFSDPSGLWRGVVGGDTSKIDFRATEQRITPWQDDATVSKCPLCMASFHPLTNRKHHCRLCGQIICSLPIKHPQRKVLCSVLFVVDKRTRQIEEVGEGVDYGVRKRTMSNTSGPQARQEEEDKFLKGVRICRECRPILLRQQQQQQAQIVPSFVKFYEDFINLETDIEESLPKFQELLLSLNHNDQPTKEASAARKRLLESFAQYDKLSKKIRTLPCPNGPGSSQDRVQMAIMTRASLFLQKYMFPLQSLPTPHTSANGTRVPKSPSAVDGKGTQSTKLLVDLDSALAQTLQPLLEQENLLMTFVEEAQAQRKFEDVKTLKVNLAEIRREIERLLDGSFPERRRV